MNVLQLRTRVLRPALGFVGDGLSGFASPGAEELLLGTAAVESGFVHLAQLGSGPALGLWQIEPATAADCHEHFLAFRPGLQRRVQALLADQPDPALQLATNLAYAAVIARLIYWRRQEHWPLPAEGDVAGQTRIWKVAYNTAGGAGTEAKYIDAWRRLVAPELGGRS